MKVWKAVTVFMVVGMLENNSVFAGGETAENFLNGCKDTLRYWDTKKLSARDNQVDMGYCLGVVAGVRETLQTLTGGETNRYPGICLPENYIDQMGVQVIVKSVKDHPDFLKKSAGLITLLALKAEYPCK